MTREQIDAILPFLDTFETTDFTAGDWNFEPGQFPWFNFHEVVLEFIQALYRNEWVTPKANWTKWQGEAKRYVESPERIDSADTATIQKLFTTHVRTDRFCEGHLAAMFENGHIMALLRRLRDIREAMSG